MTTTTEPRDQSRRTPFNVGGAIRDGYTSDLKTAVAGAENVYTFAQTVTISYNRQILHFRNGVGYLLDNALYNFLTTNGITVNVA